MKMDKNQISHLFCQIQLTFNVIVKITIEVTHLLINKKLIFTQQQ